MLNQNPVLIVEDNAFVALDLSIAVEDLNGTVIGPAGSVAEALSLIKAHKISAAVLDCQLSDRDVTPVALLLIGRGVPFVIHSGTGLPPELVDAHPDLPVLSKPLQPRSVIEALIDRMRTFGSQALCR